MANTLGFFRPTTVRASASSPGRSDPINHRKPASSNWWSPLFGWSSDPDYIRLTAVSSQKESGTSKPEPVPVRPRPKFGHGCFTEEKAKKLRKKTAETSTFHDIMYHSAIASRLASDAPKRSDEYNSPELR
ncbi:hypothetical protein L6164_004456 [Bauhinia variegata]|uniref:Uncharacterized protein n=1 Tax=Bauhinia variegata TaxID=167791 RepID=A0ACB9Q4H7_BAUVA|nr:hypothetical protein L6164_004456 [Bauhinia variegata]